jgi:signal transduction histidine kinase
MPFDQATGSLRISTGAGIGGLKERVKQLGGEVNILRAEPGTLVEAIIPLFSIE